MIFDQMSRHIDPGFKPARVLDFGCGVGRLTIPLASRSENVTGIDVSPSMLREAEKNCSERKAVNADFRPGLDSLGSDQRFDFINSYIVLQHIPPDKGHAVITRLLEKLSPGGCGAIHMTYHDGSSLRGVITGFLRKKIQVFNYVFNLIKGDPMRKPYMQMNAYNMNGVLWELQNIGCVDFHSLFTFHGGHGGQILLFRKPESSQPLQA